MTFVESMKEVFESGDPTVRSWFLVESYWMPFVLCGMYVFFIRHLGPEIMRFKEPFNLRLLMIVYNFCIVFAYVVCLLTLIFIFFTTDAYSKICESCVITKGHYTYTCTSVGWFIYVLKYVELADTIFFVLRKKNHLVTNLHVIHHAMLPIICWVMMRTETSGFQLIPASINSFVHVIMYTYYGLAAMGPEMQKKLWWKEYLTLLQMGQFVVILLFLFVVVPLSGCKTSSFGIYIDIFFATLFLALFVNFYTKTYKSSSLLNKITAIDAPSDQNGSCRQNGDCHNSEKYKHS